MFRVLLWLMLAILLSAGGEQLRSLVIADRSVQTEQSSGHCCPHGPSPVDDDDADCDVDCGFPCCATGLAALAPAAPGAVSQRTPPGDLRISVPPRVIRDLGLGPPPTPPPIV